MPATSRLHCFTVELAALSGGRAMDWEPVEKALTAATLLILHALLAAVFIL
jgi:hypothetical protein